MSAPEKEAAFAQPLIDRLTSSQECHCQRWISRCRVRRPIPSRWLQQERDEVGAPTYETPRIRPHRLRVHLRL